MPAQKLCLRNRQAPGDILMLTAAVRDLHRQHPGRFQTAIETSCPDLWRNNPHISTFRKGTSGVRLVDCEYPLIHRSNQAPYHFIHGFTEHLSSELEIPITPSLFKGDLHLSKEEKRSPSQVADIVGDDVPFWILVAGGKYDFTIKWWQRERWQAVVDHFRGRIAFVQLGENGHFHPALEGVIDLRGKTTLRQVITLMHHAQGVACPVTFMMHLAAAVETKPGYPQLRPCVVVAGGREGPHWEAYPGHQFLHNVGSLPCCSHGGCWRSRTLPLGDDDEKDKPENLCVDVVDDLPHCMAMIEPKDVIQAIESYVSAGAADELTIAQARLLEPHLSVSPWQRVAKVHRIELDKGSQPPAPPKARRTARITICLLTYGNYPELAKKAIRSIRKHCRRRDYTLVVGANAPGPALRDLLRAEKAKGTLDVLIESKKNLNKCPMMRRMFREVETEYVWWFDDDSAITDSSALSERLRIADASPKRVAMWGQVAVCDAPETFSKRKDVRGFVRTALWYRHKEPPISPRDPMPREATPKPPRQWRFVLGGEWLIRTSVLRQLRWPDPRLRKEGDDVFLGEAIRQRGWRLKNIGKLGVAINQEKRRGDVGV